MLGDVNSLLEKSIQVKELNAIIKSSFYENPFFLNLYVFGEVSGFKITNGNGYFTLKDKEAQIKCCIWGVSPKDAIAEGTSIIARGKVDFWNKSGSIVFVVSEFMPTGKGLLFLEFERLKKQLEKEGLFDEAHKKPIPEFPKNVLVLTSKTGAVIRDINTTIRKNNPVINIVVRNVLVQGERAAADIVTALKNCDKLGYDVIIIARGGGSLEDLAPFYDETLVRTIYDMKTPVISAVGHETDYSLCDFVADYRAPTPTAAGEKVGYDWYGLVDQVKENMQRIVSLCNNQFERKSSRVQVLSHRLATASTTFYTRKVNKILALTSRLKENTNLILQIKEGKYRELNAALDQLSPLKTLGRGFYSVSKDGKRVTSVDNVNIGDEIDIRGKDGTISAEVKKIEKEEK